MFSVRFTKGLLVIAIAAFAMSLACGRSTTTPATEPLPASGPASTPNISTSPHLAFGNPSRANGSDDNNFLVVGSGSAFSYNNARGTINWVSWKTTRDDLGDSLPRPDFRPDPRLPGSFKRIGYYEYSGSGYDRGHMVPSADRFGDPKLNEETFMMTNIVPQTSALNQFPWEKLESYVRSQVYRRFDAYQIAGVYGETEVVKRKIVAPTNCWKVVALVPRGASIDGRARIIAVDMPNIDGIENVPWQRYRTTIREIEVRTGYDLFSGLPRDVQDILETKIEGENR